MARPLLHLISSQEEIPQEPCIEIIPTEPKHLRELGADLREEDKAEILAFGLSVEKALWRSYKGSLIKKTALVDGKVAACWGAYGTFLSMEGQPWLLTSSAVYNVSALKFARIYQKEVNEMLKLFDRLSNIVDVEYKSAIRLLEIVGFKLQEPEIVGTKGKLFIRFERGK